MHMRLFVPSLGQIQLGSVDVFLFGQFGSTAATGSHIALAAGGGSIALAAGGGAVLKAVQ